MNQIVKHREVVLIFGKTGSGKSALTKTLIKNYSRIIIIDYMREYINGTIFYSFQDLIDYHMQEEPENFSYICRFDSETEIDFLFRFCMIIKNIAIVLEECSMYVSQNARSSEFLKLVRIGRHSNISLIGISRRTTELHTDFKAMVDTIISFKQVLENDLKTMYTFGFTGLENLVSLQDEILSTGKFREPIENVHYIKISQ